MFLCVAPVASRVCCLPYAPLNKIIQPFSWTGRIQPCIYKQRPSFIAFNGHITLFPLNIQLIQTLNSDIPCLNISKIDYNSHKDVLGKKKQMKKEESRSRDETERRQKYSNYLNKNILLYSWTGRIQLSELVHKITLSF